MIETFDDLLEIARGEPVPVKLLTVLVRAQPMMQTGSDGNEVAIEGEGMLTPVMVKSHAVADVPGFEYVRADADAAKKDWTFLMVGVLPGQAGRAPADEIVDEQLKNMARAIHAGSGLDRYLFFDRSGAPVQIGMPEQRSDDH
ncbi:MAG: hypothetical protein HND55_14895 [Pseudomonadota bacterium]|nr:MAG: hypothetical protein HND55_14895 [Pseudomonadota bacterium]